MFQGTLLFNSDLSRWIVSAVTTMQGSTYKYIVKLLPFILYTHQLTNTYFLLSFFVVFSNSGFNRTLCGSRWDPDDDVNGIQHHRKNAFKQLGTSIARYGCCPANKYMSSPEGGTDTFVVDANSCSACPAGTWVSPLTSVPNDETSCQKCDAGSFSSTQGSTSCQLCLHGKSSNAGSASCGLTTIKLPNGNGADRVGNTLGRIVDDILGTDSSKKDAATETYGPIENWDVSDVIDLSHLFKSKGMFNADLSSWVVSRVTNMEEST